MRPGSARETLMVHMMCRSGQSRLGIVEVSLECSQ